MVIRHLSIVSCQKRHNQRLFFKTRLLTKKTDNLKMSQEERAKETLYKLLKLLKTVYPTSTVFENVFRPDMFAKINKGAFQEVVHFLLCALDHNLVKNSLTSWPILEPRLESKFRTELVAIVHNLRAEGAPLEAILASQLIAPGGMKSIKFLLSLTRFTMYKHLKKNHKIAGGLLEPIKPHKDPEVTKAIIKGLKSCTENKRRKNSAMFEKYVKDFEAFKSEAAQIQDELACENQKMREVVEQHETVIEDSRVLTESVNKKKEVLKTSLEAMKAIKEAMVKCCNLIKSAENSVLEYKRNELPAMDCDKLDLVEFFEILCKVLGKIDLENPPANVEELRSLKDHFNDIGSRYEGLIEQIVGAKGRLLNCESVVSLQN